MLSILLVLFMPKTDTFFIRHQVACPRGTYNESPIDLGAFVDALGKSVLRILNVEGEFVAGPDSQISGTIENGPPFMKGDNAGGATWQLTTQQQNELVGLDNKSIVAKGQLWARNPDTSANPPATTYSDSHLPQHFSQGYLVAVEQLYLAAHIENEWSSNTDEDGDVRFNIVLECQVETLSEKAAMALALSQS